MEFILNFLPVIADHAFDPITGALKIEIIGVGSSPSDWLDTFIFWLRFILATVVGMLAAFGSEYVFKVFRGEIVHVSR